MKFNLEWVEGRVLHACPSQSAHKQNHDFKTTTLNHMQLTKMVFKRKVNVGEKNYKS